MQIKAQVVVQERARVIEEEPPSTNIEFLERRPDLNRGHQNLKPITV
ncbi:94_t:CDS:2 [Dentiscutata erythropus]|uniref:94_t:CDS:1 n=1 Tax=Dentiscutata erythropus TaxID=1348616 RepID=A0A9N9GBG7_9GLOM|nr:94_t:CDS:2 [Dentiscutata erythropus]